MTITLPPTSSVPADRLPAAGYNSDSYTPKHAPAKSIYQDDARLFHRAGFTPDPVARINSARLEGNRLTADLQLVSGASARLSVEVCSALVLRLRFWRPGTEDNFRETSEMLVPLAHPPCDAVTLTETADAYGLRFGERCLTLGRSPFSFVVCDHADGRRIFELETEEIAGSPVVPPLGFRHGSANGLPEPFLSWRIGNGEQFFGLGEKWNKVEKTSTRATVWASDTAGSNTTDLSYKSLPVLFSTAGWGLLLHTTFRSFWEVGTFSYTAGSALTEDAHLDAFLFFGERPKDLITAYTDLTGRPAMPPLWSFGVWMSRCQYMTAAEVHEVIERLRAEEFPCDVVNLDLWLKTHYYYRIGVDACDFERSEERFPDLTGLMAQWRERGIRTCLWVNPYLPEGSPIHEEARSRGFLLQRADGRGPARLEFGEPVGMLDFSHPEAKQWWKEHLAALLRDGASVFKADYGDRVPEDAVGHDGRTGRELHNAYLALFTTTAFEAAREVNGDHIVWRRAGYVGSQRYPGTWAGDTQVSWEGMRCCLRGGLSAGWTGEAFWSHDIGGFVGPAPSPELFIRWAQWGLLSPFARFHGNTPREPWVYGETALAVCKHYARLRYRLLPYLLACAAETVRTGVPILRHTKIEFPDEPGVEHLDTQYFLGGDLLVAPVMEAGARARDVYFPSGVWRSLDDPSVTYAGPRFHRVAAPLERVPVFVRAGAVLPTFTHEPVHLQGPLPTRLGLEVYAPGDGLAVDRSVEFQLDDDTVRAEARFDGDGAGTVSLEPGPFLFDLRPVGFGPTANVRQDGHPLPASFATDGGEEMFPLVGGPTRLEFNPDVE